MVQLSIIFCFCLVVADLVESGLVTKRENDSNCSVTTAEGVSVTVSVNGGSRCGTDCKMNCCADVKNRLTAIEQALQQIVLEKNATNPTTTPTATPTSERDPLRSCKETLDQGFTESGVYTIDPDDGYGPFEVYCDVETASGGWAVFQRREDGSVDFYRDWVDYKKGFGDLDKEFWLGLHKIRRLTKESPQALRFDMSDLKATADMLNIKRLT